MIVGREEELDEVAAALAAARAGRTSVLVWEGVAGVGKTALLDAAADMAPDFRRLHTVGTEVDLTAAYAALHDLVSPLRGELSALPPPQRAALDSALGWSTATAGGVDPDTGAASRHLVSAATLSLLAAAATRAPVLVLVDDLQWIDAESLHPVTFAARRMRHDAVVFLMTRRVSTDADQAVGLPRRELAGLRPAAAAALLAGSAAERVVTALVESTGGNPLALIEAIRGLTPEQRRGSAALPQQLPVAHHLRAAFDAAVRDLSPAARWGVGVLALRGDSTAGPVVDALRSRGYDADAAIAEAEAAGLVDADQGRLTFRHPVHRAAAARSLTPADRRAAHAALAAALADGDPLESVRHAAQACVGHDDDLAERVEAVATAERIRGGFASASALLEHASRLRSTSTEAARCRASAVEDALLAGDVAGVRRLVPEVLGMTPDPPARGLTLLCQGMLEQFTGSVPESERVLRDAVTCADGLVRLRALTELARVGYRLGSRATVDEAADWMARVADLTDPEQLMMVRHAQASALGFAGRMAEARGPMVEALTILETHPRLRDDPAYLLHALLAAAWTDDLQAVDAFLARRLQVARTRGAIGLLPLVLSLLAEGAVVAGRHQRAYAWAGEAVELGTELGYAVDLATAHQALAWEEAARGRHDRADASLAEARRLAARAGVLDGAVALHLVEAFAAVCRGDAARVVEILEARIAADGGRLPRGDYELAVAPDLVEAYLALGRRDDAVAVAAQHAALHRHSPSPGVRADVARLAGMLAADDASAEVAFAEAHEAHVSGSDPFAAARTRLLHGARLRRAGQRIAAREQLRQAADAFSAMGLDQWAARAGAELDALGLRARRRPAEGQPLTSQEVRVGLLIAQGLSNREIAAQLFLSPKTVETHVTSLLRKYGLRSRAAVAARFAAMEVAPGRNAGVSGPDDPG